MIKKGDSLDVIRGKNGSISAKRVLAFLSFASALFFAYQGDTEFAKSLLTLCGAMGAAGLGEVKNV
jgi:hypothetical protein